jgi:hypothetical protein
VLAVRLHLPEHAEHCVLERLVGLGLDRGLHDHFLRVPGRLFPVLKQLKLHSNQRCSLNLGHQFRNCDSKNCYES